MALPGEAAACMAVGKEGVPRLDSRVLATANADCIQSKRASFPEMHSSCLHAHLFLRITSSRVFFTRKKQQVPPPHAWLCV